MLLKGIHFYMRLSARERQVRSRLRQKLWEQLQTLRQNTESMRLAPESREPDAAAKIKFGEQEQAKLREQIRTLELGYSRQRAWNRGEKI